MQPERPPAGAERDRLDRGRAWATLLPAALLATPLVHGVPSHVSAGAGWAAFGAIPAALLLVLAPPSARRAVPLAALLALVAAAIGQRLGRADGLDPFEADRAVVASAVALVLALSGASLGRAGRETLARGAALLSLAWVAGAGIDALLAPARRFAGVLENTGELSAAALPGALSALGLAAATPGRWRLFAFVCAPSYALYAALVPVHAGTLALALAAGAALVLRRGRGETTRVRATLATLALGAAAAFAQGALERGSRPDAAGAEPAVRSSLGGVPFRLSTWPRALELAADHPWLGVGPGQFARAFPPYRDSDDIERASFGRRAPYLTEVEHAHNDWIEGLVEYGFVIGGAFVISLAYLVLRAVRALAALDPVRAALAAAALAVLACALLQAPLLTGPGSLAIAWPILGALLAGERRARAPLARTLALAAASALCFALLPAREFIAHGRALSRLVEDATAEVRGRVVHLAEEKRRALDEALAARPDSVTALSESAHLLRERGVEPERQLALWERVLALRPHRFEALMSAGNLHARAGRLEAARELYELAAALDPRHPGLATNRALLAIEAGDPAAISRALARLDELGALDREWLESTAARELLRGRAPIGMALLERAGHGPIPSSGDEAYALSRTAPDPLLADALMALADLFWAREHAFGGDFATAVRMYRQALSLAGRYEGLPDGGARLRLELAAALVRDGRADEARRELEGRTPSPRERLELPEWVGQALGEAGLLDR